MKLVSTTLTLFFKIFIPTFWLAFFGILILSLIFYISREIPLFKTPYFIIGSIIFYVIGLLTLLYLFMRLKRVEVDENYIYVSNYFKTYRYTHESVLGVKVQRILFLNKIRLYLSQKGSFGDRIVFISTNKRWNESKSLPVFSH